MDFKLVRYLNPLRAVVSEHATCGEARTAMAERVAHDLGAFGAYPLDDDHINIVVHRSDGMVLASASYSVRVA